MLAQSKLHVYKNIHRTKLKALRILDADRLLCIYLKHNFPIMFRAEKFLL